MGLSLSHLLIRPPLLRRLARNRLFAASLLLVLRWMTTFAQAAEPQAAAPPARTDDAAARKALDRGVLWLLDQQADDGGWHSQTYGALRQGAAVTSLVLHAAAHWPKPLQTQHRERLARGFAFLLRGLSEDGHVANPDGSLDYPEYATALALTAAQRLDLGSPSQRQRMSDYLIRCQVGEKRGFTEDQVHFGGWDLLGPTGPPGVSPDTNVSLAAFVLPALASRDDPAAQRVRAAALIWLSRAQNLPGDGGFVFTPQRDSENNKAQWTDKQRKQPRSYATATADGVTALVSCGLKPSDKRLSAALSWLTAHGDLKQTPGFEDAPAELGWKEGLVFYYYASLSQALAHFPQDQATSFRARLQERLLALQKSDGHWQNDSSRMREDDPLIATSFALVSLSLADRR